MIKKKISGMTHEGPEIQISGSFITEFPSGDDLEKFQFEPGNLPILVLNDEMVYPTLPQPVKLQDEQSETLAKWAFENKECLGCFMQHENVEHPSKVKDFIPVGTVAKVIKLINLPGAVPVAFLLPAPRVKLKRIVKKSPYLIGNVETLPLLRITENEETEIILKEISDLYSHILDFMPEQEASRMKLSLSEIKADPERQIFFMANNSPLSPSERAEIICADSYPTMLETFLKLLYRAFNRLELQADIQMRTHEDFSRAQKEEFLKRQMKAIQNELSGESESGDVNELKERASKLCWSKDARHHFDKELQKLERINSNSPDYSVQYSYLDTLLNLPWQKYSPDNFALSKVEKILDRDHYGLESVKERIIEQMAVIKLRNDLKAPIICLYGPPGVGKTSLGKSIADALGREYARISLGGLHDESEIRGHRRTYIGAMPGRILAALAKCGTGNPVFVLDEIDKIGKDFKGDPSTALLEVLDPEQNSKFHDNYIDFDYDLSKIMFIATANSLSELSRPLLDRMEIIEIGGYIPEEKIEIAKRHLVPKSLKEHGFPDNEIIFSKEALRYIIDRYTRESGVRQLEKKIAKVLRKLARLKASEKE
ncbi:MAG: AAA family ATPase, partial [Muribaculaceae bacterium]|nr:AAA family ATPase [Muribaculaceae bacterium]